MDGSVRGLLSTLVLASGVLLVGCSPASTPPGITLQTALPTPTLEPTFTPLPTAPPAQPTSTPIPPTALSGRILDRETNRPIGGATVGVGSVTAIADADGRYTLAGLPPGQYVLSVTYAGYDPGLSSIFTLAAGQSLSLDLTLYAKDASPYPQDPMLTNPLDPAGAPTAQDAERLARLQGLTGKVTKVEETKLRGTYLINYMRGGEVRAAVASLDHDAWALTDQTGHTWWIIKVCGNLARLVPTEVKIATPQPRSLPPLAQVLADGVSVRACASQTCAAVGTLAQGKQVEVFGCLADGGWCQVGLSGGKRGWCTGKSLRQLAVAKAVPVVATRGGKIAFSSDRDGNGEIYVMDADGSDQTRLTHNAPRAAGPSSWSPDGSQIAFMALRGSNLEIYAINADGSGQTNLTNTDNPVGDERGPSWSPDGKQIAFFRQGGDGFFEICIMHLDNNRAITCLPHGPAGDMNPVWSPDGTRFAFVSRPEDKEEIYVMNVDGSNRIRLTNNPATDFDPSWSPDGKWIAFSSNRDGNYEIYAMSADGGSPTRLTNSPALDSDPSWSPDSTRIAFTSERDGGYQIYVVNLDGTGLTQLTSEGNNAGPVWSQ
jgi:Tol biopolymer transport system component